MCVIIITLRTKALEYNRDFTHFFEFLFEDEIGWICVKNDGL